MMNDMSLSLVVMLTREEHDRLTWIEHAARAYAESRQAWEDALSEDWADDVIAWNAIELAQIAAREALLALFDTEKEMTS